MRNDHRLGQLLIAVTLATMVAGCTAPISNLSLVSVENIDLSQKYTLVAEDVSAKLSSQWVLLFFGVGDLSYYTAIGDCLAANDGDVMTDVRVTASSYWFVIGSYTEYRVRGNVWKRVSETASATSNSQDLYTLAPTADGLTLVSCDGGDIRPIAVSN